ncbi:C40 family peptidase [Actinomadura madurae]|uniref:C40 family peptidase n=1 Tax=Actinomadura madurae TaxID=1993 RepID=UPI001C66C025|nr:C40 family peptidase [Actinomadura madurae]
MYRAIWQYNHAGWYVRKVLAQAARYVGPTATGRGAAAVRAPLRWLGTLYSWGGGGPSGPSYGIAHGAGTKGFDCSGLTQYAWAKAGIRLPRVAAAQYNAGTHIPRPQLQPGDLLFFANDTSNPATIHHVGIYYGPGRMIHAPHTGDVVRISPFTGNPTANAKRASGRRSRGTCRRRLPQGGQRPLTPPFTSERRLASTRRSPRTSAREV